VLDRTNQIAADRVAILVRRVMGNQPMTKPIGPNDDLRACGLSSLGLVNLMLSVETEFRLQVPEDEMTPANFRTIARIVELIDALSGQAALSA
jgi:acyl carrier protein